MRFKTGLVLMLILALGVNLAHAGVGLTNISGTTKFYPIETKKVSSSSLFIQRQLFDWHLHQLQKGVRDMPTVGKELILLDEIRKMFEQKALIVDWVLTSRNKLEAYDKYVGRFDQDDDMKEIRENLALIEVKRKAGEKIDHEEREIQRIARIIREARESSQKVMTQEDKERILALCKAALFNEAQRLIMVARNKIPKDSSSSPLAALPGAYVTCSSEVIK